MRPWSGAWEPGTDSEGSFPSPGGQGGVKKGGVGSGSAWGGGLPTCGVPGWAYDSDYQSIQGPLGSQPSSFYLHLLFCIEILGKV